MGEGSQARLVRCNRKPEEKDSGDVFLYFHSVDMILLGVHKLSFSPIYTYFSCRVVDKLTRARTTHPYSLQQSALVWRDGNYALETRTFANRGAHNITETTTPRQHLLLEIQIGMDGASPSTNDVVVCRSLCRPHKARSPKQLSFQIPRAYRFHGHGFGEWPSWF